MQQLQLGFTHNPVSQIATASRNNDAFAWVGHGSGSQAYAVNGLNQYTSIAGAAQSHDANGNLTGDGSSSFTYDVENRLIAATGALAASLTYDPLGRLYQVSSGTSTRRFLYDQDAMVAEYDGSGTMLRRYLHGPGVDDPLAWYEGAGLTDRRALHADERGSIIAVTDASGNALAINAYDEYGRPQTRPIANGTPGAITSNALTGTFGYTGQIWLPEIKAYYYKARMYDPKGGRFYQVDPIGYEGGNNLYAGMGGDPVNLTDPQGTQSVWKEIGEWAQDGMDGIKRIPGDMQKLGESLAEGRIGYIIGGLPPGIGGGLVGNAGRLSGQGIALARAAQTARNAPSINPKIYVQLERQLAKDGPRSINNALRSAERALANHKDKLQNIAKEGGYTSKVETTIRNV